MFGFFKRKNTPEYPDRWPNLVDSFVSEMETGQTDDWCKCLWRIHPDDQGGKPGTCMECGVGRTKHLAEHHTYRGVRRVRIDNHPYCPLHTKEGLILKFLEWSDQNAD